MMLPNAKTIQRRS